MNRDFKTRIKAMRLRAGLMSQQAAANAIGCERGTVGMWEAPSSSVEAIGGDYLLAVARVYKVRPESINDPAVWDGYLTGRSVDMNSIGARIRATRETQVVTRKDLAAFAGLSYTGLSDLESGKSRSTTVLHKIADRLGVSVKWLETGKGPMDSPSKAMTLDAGKLAHAIDLLRTLGEIQGVPELHADAEALVLAYGFLTEMDETVDQSNVLDLTRKIAQRLRGQLKDDGGTING